MARGKLLITSDSGALSEVVADAGLTFPTGDATGLARCMEQVLQDEKLTARLRAAGQARAANEFDERRMLERHLNIYSEVAACAN